MTEPFLPMLAVPGEPFDSNEYLFEVKWNGVRALAANEHADWRLWGRELADYRWRYPELAVLRRLPAGTVLDGELVVLASGVPDLDAMLARHQLTNPLKLRDRSQRQPITYVVFDLLVSQGRRLFDQPLHVRRALLQELLEHWQEPRVVFSTGVVGGGRKFFDHVVGQGHEGVLAKHLASRYVPGKRSAAWQKIKPVQMLCGVIIGFVPGRQPGRFRSLLVAAQRQDRLAYVATLRTGFTTAVRARLEALLSRRLRSRPMVSCPHAGVWVQPELYCLVRFLEWTRGGRLRGASFQRLLESKASGTDS